MFRMKESFKRSILTSMSLLDLRNTGLRCSHVFLACRWATGNDVEGLGIKGEFSIPTTWFRGDESPQQSSDIANNQASTNSGIPFFSSNNFQRGYWK